MKIPYDFANRRVCLSWQEVKFGLESQLIDPGFAIDKSIEHVCNQDHVLPEEIELAGLEPSDPIFGLVERVAKADDTTVEEMRPKWLFLALAWLFENRNGFRNALQLMEEIYSEFGYPNEIASFIPYMPTEGLSLGNFEQNEAQLYGCWLSYLETATKRYGKVS